MEVGNESCSSFALKGQMQPSSRCFGWNDGMGWLPGISFFLGTRGCQIATSGDRRLSKYVIFLPSGLEALMFCVSFRHHTITVIEWIYFLIFLSFSICITCYMQWLPNFPSQLIVAPSNFHLSKRFYKFRNTAPLAFAEILLIIGGLVYQCQELCKHRILAVIYNV